METTTTTKRILLLSFLRKKIKINYYLQPKINNNCVVATKNEKKNQREYWTGNMNDDGFLLCTSFRIKYKSLTLKMVIKYRKKGIK